MFSNEIPIIIAEVGQNHNGNIDSAREYIKIFSALGADAIKFQTRNNILFSKNVRTNYNDENALTKTYGAHRELLELDLKYLEVLKNDCVKYGVNLCLLLLMKLWR